MIMQLRRLSNFFTITGVVAGHAPVGPEAAPLLSEPSPDGIGTESPLNGKVRQPTSREN